MKHLARIVFPMAIVGASNASAATFGSSTPMLCALQSVTECVVGDGCGTVSPESVSLPDFVEVDPRAKRLSATRESGSERQTKIERAEQLDGRLILQGADDGVEGVRDGLAWSMAIDEESGKMVVSASGDGFALVVFGACTLR